MQGKIPTGGLKEVILSECEGFGMVPPRSAAGEAGDQGAAESQKGIDTSRHLGAIKSAMESVVFHR